MVGFLAGCRPPFTVKGGLIEVVLGQINRKLGHKGHRTGWTIDLKKLASALMTVTV
jgi:hypothetical protein